VLLSNGFLIWLENVWISSPALETESNKSDGPALTARSARNYF